MGKCEKFKKLSSDKRLKFAGRVHACFNCLKWRNHGKKECKAPRACAKADCKRKHHTLLHDALEKQFRERDQNPDNKKPQENKATEQILCTSISYTEPGNGEENQDGGPPVKTFPVL